MPLPSYTLDLCATPLLNGCVAVLQSKKSEFARLYLAIFGSIAEICYANRLSSNTKHFGTKSELEQFQNFGQNSCDLAPGQSWARAAFSSDHANSPSRSIAPARVQLRYILVPRNVAKNGDIFLANEMLPFILVSIMLYTN